MFEDDIRQINIDLISGLQKAAEVLKEDIDSKTPEDTRELLSRTRITSPSIVGGEASIEVFNDAEYAFFVEFGVGGREYNYNKPKGTRFYRGVGARMFTRARDEQEQNIRNILDQSL